MRLWHESMIKKLPRQQLSGQHRECCGLRGKGWGKKHSVVNYVFEHSIERLICYHYLVMNEMENRGYNVDSNWRDINYRGKELGYDSKIDKDRFYNIYNNKNGNFYDEHDVEYYNECVKNLKNKGVNIDN